MRVVKFGGSSVADVACLRRAAALVAELRAEGPVSVVVSAMAGVTDALIRVGQSAIAGDLRTPELLEALAWRHEEVWAALAGDPPQSFTQLWDALTGEARTLARRCAGLDAQSRAWLVAQFSGWGERLVAPLLAAALREAGVVAEAFDDAPIALSGLAAPHSEPQPSSLATRARLLPRLALLMMRGGVPVLPGYIARDSAGALTTLGRNGSDHSAAVIAAALGAERLTIYSDVPGMLTADPRLASDAALLPLLTYDEAQRMATLGARALHPRTIEPLVRWQIPLELRAAATPHAPGTDILPDAAIPRSRARDAAWIVAAHPLGDGAGDARLTEVSAAWLPAWPLSAATYATPWDCAEAALARLPLDALGAREIRHTRDGIRLLTPTAQADATVRTLHTALHDCAAQRAATTADAALAAGA
ncbi:MAG TPA: aspartate kinase [Ktedonobacterales bacterium]|jgi:aspartate kinase|nr:aspartate kinase [Ktedonobacterales bacterium]